MTISTRVSNLEFTIPAQTPIDTPWTNNPQFGDIQLHKVEVRIPPGWNGAAGFQILSNDSFIIPWGETSDWMVESDAELVFTWEDEVDTALYVNGYNLGAYDHTAYMRFFYTPIVLVTATIAVTPLVATS